MKKFLAFLFLVGILGTSAWLLLSNEPPAEAEATPVEEAVEENPEEVRIHKIQDGDVFTSALDVLGIDYATALSILEAAEDVYDFTSIKVGRELKLISQDGEMLRFEYEPGTETVVVVEFLAEGFAVRRDDIAYDVQIDFIEGTVDSSLWIDGLEAGVPEVLLLDFANTFAWTVDFAVEVRSGDAYQILYEKRFRDGEEAGVGDILAASYTNVGETDWGYLYYDEEGKKGYYDEDGESLVKAFLKAPLNYSRITSGYTYARFHPVLGRSTPHRAIDYAAPTGTPIMAVGDGTIRFAGWNGGYGNFVKVSHNERFTTNYAHLVSFAKGIRPGTKVRQGDVIGYVGSTGFSTGPHLHYEIEEYGTLVNPLEVELPPGEAVPEAQFEAFASERDRLKQLIAERE